MTSLQAKNILNSRLECKEHTPFMTEMAKIIADHMVKTIKNHILWGSTYLYSPYKGVHSPKNLASSMWKCEKASSSTKQLFFSTFDALKYKLVLFKDDCSS